MPSIGATGSIDAPPRLVAGLLDWALGLSALGWAVRGIWEWPWLPAPLAIAALNAVVGVLFLRRVAPGRLASPGASSLCLGSVLVGAVALRLGPPWAAWPPLASALLSLGALGAAGSLATLGTSFGVLPALRPLVTRGPYRWVRHPAYGCELVMLLGGALAAGAVATAVLVPAAVALTGLRVHLEERLLAESPGYLAYRRRVRWRLLPGVW
jgi:protein-S-isoprenylcysteine O-methyltransferase Ste14